MNTTHSTLIGTTGTSAALGRGVRSALTFASGAIFAMVDRVTLWLDRIEQRRHLASLDDHLLRDIGVSRTDVQNEVAKRFWEG